MLFVHVLIGIHTVYCVYACVRPWAKLIFFNCEDIKISHLIEDGVRTGQENRL